MMNKSKTNKRILEGTVIRKSTDKTVAVRVNQTKIHPIYHKRYQLTKKYLVHDPKNKCQVGEAVRIEETRPRSRLKRWKIVYQLTPQE